MGYGQHGGSRRGSGREYGRPKREKIKGKVKGQKHRSANSYVSDDVHVLTPEENASRILIRLGNLGSQRFAVSPYDQYFASWLMDLKTVMFEFESCFTIEADDLFIKIRSQAIANVETEFEKLRREQTSRKETRGNLSDNKLLLEQTEKEYASKTRELARQKDLELNRLSRKVENLKEDLNSIASVKTGIFRGISKKAKEQKEAEGVQRLDSARKELALVEQQFITGQEKLRDEYEAKKQPVIKRIADQQKEIENQEIDRSQEARRTACETLANAITALLERREMRRGKDS